MNVKRVLSACMAAAMLFVLTACGEKEPAGDTIKVGLMGCFSGENAMYGNAVKHGVTLYVNELNAQGGVNGKQVELVEYDDRADPSEAITAYSRMVDDGIVALIGSVTTNTTLAVADEAYDQGMPMITASATAPGVTLLNPEDPAEGIRENVFRACFIDPFQGQKMAQYAKEKLGAKSAAVIYQTGNDYCEGVVDAFTAECEKLGVALVSTQAYAKGDKDFRSQMTTIKSENPDVIFCPNYYEDSGMIVTQSRQVGVTAAFLGADSWGGIHKYASAADLEGSVYCSGYAPDTTDAVKQFDKNYQAAWNEKVPNMFAPLGYDAAMLMCAALAEAEKAVETGADGYSEAVISALKNTDDLAGVTGSYTFDRYNNPVKSAAILTLKNGEEVFKEMF